MIDCVITWVDGSDPKWLEEKQKYSDSKISSFTNGQNRFQDNGLLRYWFRGIEKFAPFFRKIFFVTYGHIPSWLNTNNEKLVIVNHRDFIPEEYLPTFNSNTILLNLHRIKGLSENFVFFNDDVFLLKPTKETDFFRKGLPCDYAVQDIISAPNLDPFWDMMINNTYVINKNFKKKACIRKHFFKWFNFKYGLKLFYKNVLLYPFNYFTGFYDHHVCASYKKQTFEEVWSKNSELLDEVCKNKFRTVNDITEWTMRYWQLAKGDFAPFNKDKFGTYTSLKNINLSISIINKNKYKCVCLNDETNEQNTIILKKNLDKLMPLISTFELFE